jgi:hypothetical protein
MTIVDAALVPFCVASPNRVKLAKFRDVLRTRGQMVSEAGWPACPAGSRSITRFRAPARSGSRPRSSADQEPEKGTRMTTNVATMSVMIVTVFTCLGFLGQLLP